MHDHSIPHPRQQIDLKPNEVTVPKDPSPLRPTDLDSNQVLQSEKPLEPPRVCRAKQLPALEDTRWIFGPLFIGLIWNLWRRYWYIVAADLAVITPTAVFLGTTRRGRVAGVVADSTSACGSEQEAPMGSCTNA